MLKTVADILAKDFFHDLEPFLAHLSKDKLVSSELNAFVR